MAVLLRASAASAHSSIEVYSSDSDLYDSDYEELMDEIEPDRSSLVAASASSLPPLPDRSVEPGHSPWTGTVELEAPAPKMSALRRAAAELDMPEPQEPEPEPASLTPPQSPGCRDPRLKLLAPASPAGSSAARDKRLQLFSKRQGARPRGAPATTATATARAESRPRTSARAKSPGLTVAVDDAEDVPAAVENSAAWPSSARAKLPPPEDEGSSSGEGYQTLARIERCLDTGAWQERLASLTELSTIALSGGAAKTIGATLRHVVAHDVSCGIQPGQLGSGKRGGKVIKASRGRSIVRGLEQQLNDQRPMILREAAAAIGALAKLCATAQKWQHTSGRFLPRLCAMCTLGTKLVCAAADAAVTAVLEETQPSAAISVLISVATTASMQAARRAHAFACLGRLLRSPGWTARPVLARNRATINTALTAGLADPDAAVRHAARAASSDHTVYIGVATVTSPRGMSVGKERTPREEITGRNMADPDPAVFRSRPASAAQRTKKLPVEVEERPDPAVELEEWIRDVTPAGAVFDYHRETGEIRTKWSGRGGSSGNSGKEAGGGSGGVAAKEQTEGATKSRRRPSTARPGGKINNGGAGATFYWWSLFCDCFAIDMGLF